MCTAVWLYMPIVAKSAKNLDGVRSGQICQKWPDAGPTRDWAEARNIQNR